MSLNSMLPEDEQLVLAAMLSKYGFSSVLHTISAMSDGLIDTAYRISKDTGLGVHADRMAKLKKGSTMVDDAAHYFRRLYDLIDEDNKNEGI